MERIVADDEQALAELIGALAPALLRFVGRTTGAATSEAEDIVQEVFVRVWRARHRWRPEARVKSYVFTIAARLCLNTRRNRSRAPFTQSVSEHTDDALPGIPDGAANPEQLAHARQLRAAINQALDQLPPTQRAAFLLRHFEGLSYRDIANALDTSESAVESLLCRGRASLRGRLAFWQTAGKSEDRC